MELNYQLSLISTLPTTTSFVSKPRKKRTMKVIKPKQTRKLQNTFTSSITRPCTECGKKFLSWKALFGHMRCHPERKWRGIIPPENIRRSNPDDSGEGEYSSSVTEDEYEVASSLLLLANGPPLQSMSMTSIDQVPESSSGRNAVFGCSSCKKVFGSHQALGGHRASHKNVKGCSAIKRNYEEWDEKAEEFGELGHRCNVCWRVFSSGQALGGHMRCHWDPLSSSSGGGGGGLIRVCENGNAGASGIDLNVPVYDGYGCDAELALDLRLGL